MEFVFFVNCGVSIDVNEIGMKGDISCVIIDHHRPIHPANAWNANVLVPLPEVTRTRMRCTLGVCARDVTCVCCRVRTKNSENSCRAVTC